MLFSKTIIGAQIEGNQLRLALLEYRPVLPGRWRVREICTIDDYANMPAPKLGEAVASFLERNRIADGRVVIALARSEAIVRRVDLPLEAEAALAKAVSYQIDSLHPFDPDEVYWDFAPLGKDATEQKISIMVFIAHRRAVEEPVQRLHAAGLKPVGVVVTTAALFNLVAALGTTRARKSSVVLWWHATHVEMFAIEDNRLVASREAAWPGTQSTPEWLEGELASVRAQMETGNEPTLLLTCGETPDWVGQEGSPAVSSLVSFLDWNLGLVKQVETEKHAGLLAIAYAGLVRRPAMPTNLLPAAMRAVARRWVMVPTYVLAAIVLFLGATLLMKNWISDVLYAHAIGREAAKLEPTVSRIRRLDDQSRALAERIDAVEGLRRQTRFKLRVLAELTRILPPDAWLQSVQINEDSVEMSGYAAAASSLLPMLEDSPYLEKVEFLSAITRSPEGKEMFRIRARITGAVPLGQEGSKP